MNFSVMIYFHYVNTIITARMNETCAAVRRPVQHIIGGAFGQQAKVSRFESWSGNFSHYWNKPQVRYSTIEDNLSS